MSTSESGQGTPPGDAVAPGDAAAPRDGEAFVVPEVDLQPGEQVGEFVVEGKLGEGGFGVVFKATHPVIGKQVAIKVLNRQYSSNPQMVSRFVAEARAVNQIRHRHIIDIFSFGQLPDGRQYYVMELLTGQPLDAYLAARGRLPLDEAIPILRAIARALDAAHAKGIAHRDLKPENIFIGFDEDGTAFPKLLDFGIAKLLGEGGAQQHKTRTGAPMGTPYYMSPEQCRGRDVDHRTDFYSFGIVAYQLLTGKLPFEGEDFMEILMKQLSELPVPPSQLAPELPESIDRGIAWMMMKEAAKRPPNLVTAVRSLEEAAVASGVALPAGSPTRSFERASGVLGAASASPTPGPAGAAAARTPGVAAPGLATAPTLMDGKDSFVAAEASAQMPATRGRTGLVIGVVLVLLAGGGVAAFVAKGKSGGGGAAAAGAAAGAASAPPPSSSPGQVPASDPTVAGAPDAATTPGTGPGVAADAAADVAAQPPPLGATVMLTVRGVPAGTEVIGPDDRVLGKAPGPIELARGDAPVKVTMRVRGYRPVSYPVTPSADRTLEVTLKPVGKPKSKDKERLEDWGD